ncbi:MAG: glycosyltransferase family 2 protein [Firmicutes bacterium]|nr:glycosyltransferase family 2 protein [Bacillota bacterium]
MVYLCVLKQVLLIIVMVFWLYQVIISLFSFVKPKDKKLLVNKQHRFMAVLPAHNEETVIRNLIRSLKRQDYPGTLLDIYVIADNCTDDTVAIAKEEGVFVYQRFDETKKTKGYALNWFLTRKVDEDADYDAFCVFDADNIVNSDFFSVMNKKLCQGEVVVQGYRDIKNPTDTWITAGYAIFYWTMNRFYHLARYNLGLSPLLNGTGFMVKFDLIKKEGWNTFTITEDIEFSLQNIANGRKLGWASEAVVYDEQPLTFAESWKQRTRWTVGHLQCLKHYTKDLLKGIKEYKTLMNVDGMLYLTGIPMMVVTTFLVLVNLAIYLMDGMTAMGLLLNCASYLLLTFALPVIVGGLSMIIDKRPLRPMIKGLLCFPFFLGSWILINFRCLIKQDVKWEKISHVRDIKIEEVQVK